MQTFAINDLQKAAQLLSWQKVPDLMLEYFEKSAGVAERYGKHKRTLYYNPETDLIKEGSAPEDMHVSPWVKLSSSPTVQTAMELGNYFPNKLNRHLPGLQSPMGAALTSGLIGGGLGYAGGAALEHLLPSSWRRKRLRRTLALMGGLGAAAPALAWAGVNAANDKSVLDGWPLDDSPATPTKISSFIKVASLNFQSETGLSDQPLIDVNAFNQTLWTDPRVSQRLSPIQQAAASGLLTGAATLAGGGRQTKFITPWDVGRMAAGMGTGYLSGALVGKSFGLMMGMPQGAQDTLKQTGMWAGVVANMVPLAFGG